MPHAPCKLTEETQTAYVIRIIREQALAEVRDGVMSMKADVSAIAREHETGYQAGYRAAQKEAFEIVMRAFNQK